MTVALRDDDFAHVLIGSRLLRRNRIRRLLLAHLLREKGAGEGEDSFAEDMEDEDEGDDESGILRMPLASRVARRHRMRRQLLAHLMREKDSESDEDETESSGEDDEDDEDAERRILRLLIASRILQRRRVRRVLLARLLRARRAGEDEEEFGEGETGEAEEGSEKERRLIRLLIGSQILRRRRARQMLLAHLMRERRAGAETGEDEESGEDEDVGEAEDGSEKERRILRLLIGSNVLRRRRIRRMVLAHLLNERRKAA